ncbi:MAG: restriction endonuclease subunit S [Bacteroidales bacterium]|nr:restriction endonuclease subunit S [Bacteroidales bacterium]
MSEWKKVKLGEVCSKIGSGATPKGGAMVYINYGTSLIRSQNVYNLSFEYDGLSYITENAAEKLKSVTILPNDILLNITGDSVARTCIVPNNVLPARVNQHVAIIRPKDSILNSKFLVYYLASPSMQAHMLNLAVGKGASRNAITKAMIENFEVPCPSIHTQHRIATILSRYDSLIENYQKQIKLLEESAQRLYKEWFIDLRFPGHENTKIVDGVPEGWEKKTLSDIATIIMGQSPKSEFYNSVRNGLPFHQGVGSYGFRFVVDNVYSTSFTRIAESNSILFSVRAPVGRLNITKNKIVIGRGLAAINHKKGHQSFLYYLLKEKFFKDNIIGNGAIFASISKDELYNQVFVIPSDEMVMRYDTIANKIDKDIQYIDSQIYFLTEGRDRLLPKLMSGEIEV